VGAGVKEGVVARAGAAVMVVVFEAKVGEAYAVRTCLDYDGSAPDSGDTFYKPFPASFEYDADAVAYVAFVVLLCQERQKTFREKRTLIKRIFS